MELDLDASCDSVKSGRVSQWRWELTRDGLGPGCVCVCVRARAHTCLCALFYSSQLIWEILQIQEIQYSGSFLCCIFTSHLDPRKSFLRNWKSLRLISLSQLSLLGVLI